MGGNLTQYVVFPSFRLGATVSILRQRVVCEGGEGERRSVMEALVRKVPDDQQVRVASLLASVCSYQSYLVTRVLSCSAVSGYSYGSAGSDGGG